MPSTRKQTAQTLRERMSQAIDQARVQLPDQLQEPVDDHVPDLPLQELLQEQESVLKNLLP